MISLSGLSATYPGYAAQEDQTAKTQANQAAAREAAIKLLGAHVLGQALVGQGPQPPAPGQASVPSAPSAVPGAAGPTSVGGAPLPPPPSAPPGGAPQVPPAVPPGPAAQPPAPVAPAAGGAPALPEISLQGLTQRILQTSPGVANHPEILLAALERAAPMLDRQGKEDLAEIRNQFTMQRIQSAKDRLDEAKRWHDLVSADKGNRESNINDRTGQRQEGPQDRFNRLHPNAPAVGVPSPDSPPAPSGPAPAAGPTATDPKTGAKVQWDGKAWKPLASNDTPGVSMSDASPDPIQAGQQFASGSPYQIRPNSNGTVSVINIRTGQVHFTGTQSGAANAQATLNYQNR